MKKKIYEFIISETRLRRLDYQLHCMGFTTVDIRKMKPAELDRWEYTFKEVINELERKRDRYIK